MQLISVELISKKNKPTLEYKSIGRLLKKIKCVVALTKLDMYAKDHYNSIQTEICIYSACKKNTEKRFYAFLLYFKRRFSLVSSSISS